MISVLGTLVTAIIAISLFAGYLLVIGLSLFTVVSGAIYTIILMLRPPDRVEKISPPQADQGNLRPMKPSVRKQGLAPKLDSVLASDNRWAGGIR